VLRLDGNSDLDFEMFDVKWDGTLKRVCLVFLSGTKVPDLFAMKNNSP
jgi:hypothetical protein